MRTKQFCSERTMTLLGWSQAGVASQETPYSCLQIEISADARRVEVKAAGAPGLLLSDQFKQEARGGHDTGAVVTQFAIFCRSLRQAC